MVIFFIKIIWYNHLAPHSEPPDYPKSDLKSKFDQMYHPKVKRHSGRYIGSKYACQKCNNITIKKNHHLKGSDFFFHYLAKSSASSRLLETE